MNEIVNFSGNIESTKTADNILEMPEQGEFRNNCFKNHACKRGRLVNAANNFKDHRRSSSRPGTVMFRGTPSIYFGFRC